jgi:hypothetical protein
MPPRYVLVANPGTKRCELYRRELAAFWAACGATPDVTVVPWAEVVPRDGHLDGLPAFDRPAVVRLESPGKDAHVYRLLLEAGGRDDPSEPPRDCRAVPMTRGLLLRPGLWFRGFRRALAGLRRSFDARPHLTPTACPLAVAAMFDKTATARTLAAAGVPVPDALPEPPDEPAVVHDLAVCHGWDSAYVKLNSGSSATGIVVLHPTAAGRPAFGITTLIRRGADYFSTRQVQRVTGEELERAVQFVLDEGAIVQRGVPLAQLDGDNFDLRVVCVGGTPVATVVRVSPHPMTNLHLGGRRGDLARCRAAVPPRVWLDALDQCAAAADCFDSTVAGVDLAFERGLGRSVVLEVNAFGDFFPGWADARGRSVHALEIEHTARRSVG